ncbi:hypothetical protein DP939_02710 [Spongiactinospora rosea]|uniref:Uncharacterized protein n=1 Tax=Spongiactinospora rosea TaxID=2248750 RepID=A0A366M7C9_9ACTN|nr:hypothetical protein [Spongiactinospora rosea]RBQ21640.1 hypothetical protein DP939_02710 [Spongiactinospora rosea]
MIALPHDDDLLLVWDVEAGECGGGGVHDSRDAAETAMLDTLDSHPEGRGRVRYARLVPAPHGSIGDYRYGSTLITAHRADGETVSVVGDAWEDTP